jgi:PAS domain S-box-containing protein
MGANQDPAHGRVGPLPELAEALHVLSEGMVVFDREGRYLYVNPAAERLLGRPSAEVLGRQYLDLFPDSQTTPFYEAFQRAAAAGGEAMERVEFYYAPLDRWSEMHLYPVRDWVLVAWRDISERKRTDELRERLVGIVGHDLRGPLSAIGMGAARLLRRGALDDKDRATAERIQRVVGRMAGMVSQLLDFTRVRLGGGFVLSPAQIDLDFVCRQILTEFESSQPDRRINYQTDGDTTGVWDHDRLGEIVSNLVANAVQHGDPEAPIDVRTQGSGEAVTLVVKNQGEAIPPELLPSVFNAFRRTSNRKKSGDGVGLGLGLYITHELVLAHGGQIEVHSAPSEGTTFTVRLPRVAPAP